VRAATVAAAEIPPEVRQALQARVEALSPISISWTRQLGSDMSLRDWLKMVKYELKKRFYLDPSRGYAVCRREEVTRTGQTATVSEMSNFVKFDEPEIWLPKR
jgi:hypothetical protein